MYKSHIDTLFFNITTPISFNIFGQIKANISIIYPYAENLQWTVYVFCIFQCSSVTTFSDVNTETLNLKSGKLSPTNTGALLDRDCNYIIIIYIRKCNYQNILRYDQDEQYKIKVAKHYQIQKKCCSCDIIKLNATTLQILFMYYNYISITNIKNWLMETPLLEI